MNKGSMQAMEIHRAQQGGYYVIEGRLEDGQRFYRGILFADSDIDSCLNFIRDAIFVERVA